MEQQHLPFQAWLDLRADNSVSLILVLYSALLALFNNNNNNKKSSCILFTERLQLGNRTQSVMLTSSSCSVMRQCLIYLCGKLCHVTKWPWKENVVALLLWKIGGKKGMVEPQINYLIWWGKTKKLQCGSITQDSGHI